MPGSIQRSGRIAWALVKGFGRNSASLQFGGVFVDEAGNKKKRTYTVEAGALPGQAINPREFTAMTKLIALAYALNLDVCVESGQIESQAVAATIVVRDTH